MVVTGVEGVPAAAEISLEPGGKIHRRGLAGNADVAEIPLAIVRRDIHAAAQRHRKMSEVAADAAALGMGLGAGAVVARVVIAEFEMVVHVIADRLHLLPAALNAAEQRPG